MYWNYRLMRRKRGDEHTIGIYEVYYSDKGKVEGWTEDAIGHEYDEDDDIRNDLMAQLKALDKDILEYK